MKITCYILSFYFLALSGLACADTVAVDNTSDTLKVYTSNDVNDHHSHESGEDHCSPLCFCHCCHVHVVSAPGVAFKLPEKQTILYNSFFQDFRSIEISEILKPPRS